MKKIDRKKWPFIMAIIVIIIILALVIKYFLQKGNNDIFQFNNFQFKYFNGFEVNKLNDNTFTINGSNYSANVSIYINVEDNVTSLKDVYSILLDLNDIKYTDANITNINNVDVLSYNMIDTKYVLCYIDAISPYVYEVQLKNNDDSFKLDSLNGIIEMLKTAKIDENSKREYTYKKVGYYLTDDINKKIIAKNNNNQG